jgi:predicted aconitase
MIGSVGMRSPRTAEHPASALVVMAVAGRTCSTGTFIIEHRSGRDGQPVVSRVVEGFGA